MDLDPAEFPALPLPAALFDRTGTLVSATPEWHGPAPGSAVYGTGFGEVVVAADGASAELDELGGRLLDELAQAAGAMTRADAMRTSVLAAGLELVSGRGTVSARTGRGREVLEMALAATSARVSGLTVRAVVPAPDIEVRAPAAVALALVQMAANAERHAAAREVILRIAAGPTFYVEWPTEHGGGARIESHRHTLRRRRWGWGYVQLVADALGGTALPPGPSGPGVEGAALGLGSTRLTLPLAVICEGRVERASQTWDREAGRGLTDRLVAAAGERPGRIVYADLYRARLSGRRTWVALAPETGSSRARDMMRGLEHERALWAAPEPHATRIAALATLLGITLGDPWPSVPPSIWEEGFPAACTALRLEQPGVGAALVLPPPRVAAFLLADLGGKLVIQGDAMALEPARDAPLARLLGGRPGVPIRLA